MYDVILETIIDSLKLFPFLFVAFIIIELFEHKISSNGKDNLKKAGKLGPVIGSILGIFPQCGFSVLATNLYVTRIITLGTLISVYLATSDEMLPILIAEKVSIDVILKILGIKLIAGMVFGFIINLFIKEKESANYEICNHQHCHCENSIFKSSLIHALKTLLFIFIITFILNISFYLIGEDNLKHLFNKNQWFTPFISSLIGLIPNCGASVFLTELYINGVFSLGGAISGLLTGSGVAILVLFKTNNNLKENIKIISILYIIGVITGLFIEFLETF